MKSQFLLCFCLLWHFCTNAQVSAFLAIDEKKEFAGIPFLSAPDYSQLAYKNRSPNGINIYTVKGVEFRTDSFVLPDVYASVQKGRVLSFLMFIPNENDYVKIEHALSGAFDTRTDLGKNKVFHGSSILFSLLKEESTYALFMATGYTDTLPDIKDKNGIIDLLGKKATDPAVVNFITSIPGKKVKEEYSTGGFGYTWPAEGIVVTFSSQSGEATLSYIMVYFMKDNYYWRDKPFRGSIKLPYDITANTSNLQLRDMFGGEDTGYGNSPGDLNYKKFKVYCTFGNPVTQIDDDLLNHITFQ